MDIGKKTTELADDLFGMVDWVLKRLHSPGREANKESLKGAQAEVSIAITSGNAGEIIVPLGQSLQNYPARARTAEKEFPKGSKVCICDVGTNCMYVDVYEPGEDCHLPRDQGGQN